MHKLHDIVLPDLIMDDATHRKSQQPIFQAFFSQSLFLASISNDLPMDMVW